MKEQQEEKGKFKELYRRVEVTCKSRYNASTRLQWQHTLSQWTIAILSMGLIVISLISFSDIEVRFSGDYVHVMQVIFASLVLTYSLLIGTENFSQRSEKLHRCGLELGRLLRTLKPYKEGEKSDDSKYEELQGKYYDVLEKYENHTPVDFMFTRLDLSERYYNGKKIRYIIDTGNSWARYLAGFSGHIIVIAIVFSWTTALVTA